MKIFDEDERKRIKSQCNEEVLEYIEVLEDIAKKSLKFWANAYTTDYQKKKRFDDSLYDALSKVEFMHDGEEE